jgi:uncharacterized protein YlxW (UPF0749 family)
MQNNVNIDTTSNIMTDEYENKLEQQLKMFNFEKDELKNQVSTTNNKIKSLTDQINNKDEIINL